MPCKVEEELNIPQTPKPKNDCEPGANKDKNNSNRKWYQLLVVSISCTSMISMGQAAGMSGYLVTQLMEHGNNDIHVSEEKGSWFGKLVGKALLS